jgi:hypothetical protein
MGLGITMLRVWKSQFVQGVVETDHRHCQRFTRTVASGYNGCDVLRSEVRLVTLGTGTPPCNLSRVAFDTEPAASKELDVSAATSQIDRNFIGDLLQALLRLLIAAAFARASALLLAPHA